MWKISTKAAATSLLLAFGLQVHAQNIIIDQELSLRSEPLKVKMGSQLMGKIYKWKFGEYAVTESKSGVTKTSSKTNFWGTKAELKSSHKFSFTLCNGDPDCALVGAASNIEQKELAGFELFEGFIIGENVVLSGTHNFTASITLESDTSEIWYLIMNMEGGAEVMDTETSLLLGKEHEIQIVPTSSNLNNTDKRAMPALGYEFYENGQALAAAQYYGGGLMGMNKNIIWIRNDLDPRKELILAAAIIAILQHQYDEGMFAGE